MPAQYYAYPKNKVKYVGVPVPPQIEGLSKNSQAVLKRSVALPGEALVLLVSGGGNGSKRLNDLVLAAAQQLFKEHSKLYIVHIAGRIHQTELQQGYARVLDPTERARVKVFGFTNDFPKLAAASDIIFGRAGATSLAEFALLGKACIIMPSPFLAGGHQLKNAQELSDKDAAVILTEEADADEFVALVNELLSNQRRRMQLAANLSKLAKPNAAKDLAKLIISVAQRADY